MLALSRCVISERLEIEYIGLTVVEVRKISLREVTYTETVPDVPEGQVRPAVPPARRDAPVHDFVVRARDGTPLRSFGCFLDAKDWLDVHRNGHRVTRISDRAIMAFKRGLTRNDEDSFRRHALGKRERTDDSE